MISVTPISTHFQLTSGFAIGRILLSNERCTRTFVVLYLVLNYYYIGIIHKILQGKFEFIEPSPTLITPSSHSFWTLHPPPLPLPTRVISGWPFCSHAVNMKKIRTRNSYRLLSLIKKNWKDFFCNNEETFLFTPSLVLHVLYFKGDFFYKRGLVECWAVPAIDLFFPCLW